MSEGELSEGEIPDFDDGLDDNLVGDEADRRKLAMMTEKEREQELFNRMEKREALKTRMEIEQVSVTLKKLFAFAESIKFCLNNF